MDVGYQAICQFLSSWGLFIGNISGANQPLRANRANFNMGHWIHIQEDAQGE